MKIEVSSMSYEGPYAPSLWPQGVIRIGGPSEPPGSFREILGVSRLLKMRGAGDDFDTTADTTGGATRSNGGQPSAKKSAYLSRFCNLRQRPETDDIGLWLRRSRV